MRLLRRLVFLIPLLAFGIFLRQSAQAAFNPSYVISDKSFENYGVWSPSQIDSFMNGFGSSCISSLNGFRTPDPQGWSDAQNKYTFGSNVSGGQSIYDLAQLYHVSPWVIMSTLQKEQSIVTGVKGCHYDRPNASDPAQVYTCSIGGVSQDCTDACPWSYGGGCMNIALGYGCPGSCAVKDEGYEMQMTLGTWLLRFGEVRAYGTLTGYGGYETGDQNFCYRGPMTPGMRARSASATACGGSQDNVATYYDGTYTTVDGVSLKITNGATATLYNFTPYNSGNSSFYNIYSGWFGSPTSPCYSDTNISGVLSGEHVLPTRLGINHTDNLTLVQANNTGSGCAEAYIWQNGNYNLWRTLTASGSPTFNQATSSFLAADNNGDSLDEFYKVDYSGTGSGKIEVHGWTPNLQGWASHTATIQSSFSHNDSEVIGCDPAGYGHDNLFLVEYRNTSSGNLEIHEWSSNLQQWVNHWDTHYTAFSPQSDQIVCGDTNGDGKDEFYLVRYAGNTGSGRLEIHGGITNLGYNAPWPYASPAQWPVHTATISGPRTHWESDSAAAANDTDFIFADTNGDGKDEPYIIQYHGTGSGRVEIYGLTGNYQGWSTLTTTNQGQY